MALRMSGVFASIFLAATLCSAGDTRPANGGTTGGSRVVSPAVVATWFYRMGPGDVSELEVLVLWRGNPGWFLRTDSSGSSSRMVSQSGGRVHEGGVRVHNAFFGGIALNVEFDPRKRVARIQEHEVDLEGANVIFVDEVDSSDGAHVERSLRVDPGLPESPARIEAIVRRSPEIFSFLRCDAKLPDPKAQPMIDAICEQMKGP